MWAFSSCGEWRLLFLWCSGLSLWWLLLPWSQALRPAGFSSRSMNSQHLQCGGFVALRHVGSSRTRDQTCVPCIGRQILNHWTAKEVLDSFMAYKALYNHSCLAVPHKLSREALEGRRRLRPSPTAEGKTNTQSHPKSQLERDSSELRQGKPMIRLQ